MPGILNQLGFESLDHLKKLANHPYPPFQSVNDDEEEIVPGRCFLTNWLPHKFGFVLELVGDFEEYVKNEDKEGVKETIRVDTLD